jgi:DNA helicase-2/ATP-dependent DNA helicase PcrA
MTTVMKLDGAPGVGKTTALFETVNSLAAEDHRLNDILYLTFTRASRIEAAVELQQIYPSEEWSEIKKRARTFHGAALVTCLNADEIEDVDRQIITQADNENIYATFCRRQGLDYNHDKTDTLRERTEGGSDPEAGGNRLFAISEFLSLSRRPVEDHYRAPVTSPLPPSATREVLKAWTEFKRSAADLPLFEHHDYVERAIEIGGISSARSLFIDEFQDLSPLEYTLYKCWRESDEFENIYIAGDPNQSIYSFREARPFYFENTPADRVTHRKKSYRVPDAPARVARGILDTHPDTDPAGFRSAEGSGGTARVESIEDDASLAQLVRRALVSHDGEQADVFLLTRTNRQVRALGGTLRRKGIPYTTLGSTSDLWNGTLTNLHRSLSRLREGENVPAPSVKTLLDAVPSSTRNEREEALAGGRVIWSNLDDDDVFAHEDVRRAFPEDVSDIASQLPGIQSYRREALVNALIAGSTSPSQAVTIGTIHAAKGLEAPCVLLFDAYSKRVEDAYYADSETAAEEHRLYYVGATRASESLYIVRDHFDGPVFPGFEGTIPTSDAADSDESNEGVA